MTVYFNKAREKWAYHFMLGGRRYSGYCRDAQGEFVKNARAARDCEAIERRKAELNAKIPRAQDLTLARVMADLSATWSLQAHWPNRRRYVRELIEFFGADATMASIDQKRVQDYVTFVRTRKLTAWAGGPTRDPSAEDNRRYWKETDKLRGPATSNLYLGTLREALNYAAKVRDPVTGSLAVRILPKVPELSVPKRKARPIPDAILSELVALLPQHDVDALQLTLYFGFRRGEVFGLEIHNVDFDAGGVRLFAEDVKDNEDTFLPGAPAAMELLQHLVGQARDRGTNRLITWRRVRNDAQAQAAEPWRDLKRSKTAWARAMKIIEAKHGRRFRWHDIRAAFITHVAITSGQMAAQALARHSDFDTTRMYVEVADEFRRSAANRAALRPALGRKK